MDTEVCRLCLTPDDSDFRSIFENNVPLKLRICTGVIVNRNDGLSTKICSSCCFILNYFYKFKNKCIKSNNILQKIAIIGSGGSEDEEFVKYLKDDQDEITSEKMKDDLLNKNRLLICHVKRAHSKKQAEISDEQLSRNMDLNKPHDCHIYSHSLPQGQQLLTIQDVHKKNEDVQEIEMIVENFQEIEQTTVVVKEEFNEHFQEVEQIGNAELGDNFPEIEQVVVKEELLSENVQEIKQLFVISDELSKNVEGIVKEEYLIPPDPDIGEILEIKMEPNEENQEFNNEMPGASFMIQTVEDQQESYFLQNSKKVCGSYRGREKNNLSNEEIDDFIEKYSKQLNKYVERLQQSNVKLASTRPPRPKKRDETDCRINQHQMEREPVYNCPFCYSRKKNKRNMISHSVKFHLQRMYHELGAPAEFHEKLRCSICGKRFKNLDILKRHSKVHLRM